MTNRLRLAILCAAVIATPAAASEEHSSKVPTELEFYKEAGLEPGMTLPGGTNLADFAEGAREPGPKGNETPGQVRGDIQDLREQKMMNDFLNPEESAAIQKQLEAAQLRLAIAERREARDRLRKKKKPKQAARLEREIHELKAKLSEMAPTQKKGVSDWFKADSNDED